MGEEEAERWFLGEGYVTVMSMSVGDWGQTEEVSGLQEGIQAEKVTKELLWLRALEHG